MDEPRVLVSACLIGCRCRYDGRANCIPKIAEQAKKRGWIPICPEILGGLPTPRTPAERKGNRVVAKDGRDVTEFFRRGAEEAAQMAALYGAKYALLKERSPSCGSGLIYDGTFTGTRVPGFGATAEKLRDMRICVFGESELTALLERLEEEK